MKSRRRRFYVSSAIGIAIIGMVGIIAYSARKPAVFENTPKLISAMQAFTRDFESLNKPLPPRVTLRELIDGGYLAATDVRKLEGMDISLSLTVDETRPQDILVSARLPDGTLHVLTADGSAFQVTERAYRKQMGQQAGRDEPPPR